MKRLTILGVGLIGGSLALALRQHGFRGEIVGWGRRAESLQEALALGVIDRAEPELGAAVAAAEMVLVAVPVGAMEGVFRELSGKLPQQAVLTDVGSTKASVITAAQAAFGALPPRFVPGHPIAGTEKSGVAAAFPDLFRRRLVILTPAADTDPEAVAQVRALWELAGANVVLMGVRHHDEVLAATSHLPHLLAYALVDTLARMDDSWEIFRYAAGGFRDFTRIASSDPVMWHDICLANREAILTVLARLRVDLDDLARSIEGGDSDHIMAVFRRAKRARDHFATILAERE